MDYNYKCLKRNIYLRHEKSVRAITPDEIENIRLWRNDQMSVLRQKEEISKEDQLKYFETRIWKKAASDTPDNILLSYWDGSFLIGYGGFVHIDWESRRAEISFLLSTERARDKSTYTEDFMDFLCLLQEIAFNDLGFNRLYTETFDVRAHHVNALESAGFELEGRMRDHKLVEGRFVDSLIHGCLGRNNEG